MSTIALLLLINHTLGFQNASGLKNKADALLAAQDFQAASEAYAQAADAFDKKGDPNAGQILRERALRYGTQIRFFVRRAAGDRDLARGEPKAGCFRGINIEREEATPSYSALDVKTLPHALFFRYRRYGVPFPVAEATAAGRLGAGLQIAWEPDSYDEVQDDAYLEGFARAIREARLPVFLRFASEMNGSWTPYHRDPAQYRAMFRRVAEVIHRETTNGVMVWCPNEIPREPIASYYPGPDAVDWVGVNFYSVPFNDADRARDAMFRWPSDQVEYVYGKYAKSHPIMVGEWAASHLSSVDHQPRPEFAIRKIRQFYGTVPLLYSRLKAIHWLSFNALKYAKSDRQLNNYSLFEIPSVASAYTEELRDDAYVGQIRDSSDTEWQPVTAQNRPRAGETVAIWCRTYDDDAQVTIKTGGQTISERDLVRKTFTYAGPISVVITDSKNRTAARASFP